MAEVELVARPNPSPKEDMGGVFIRTYTWEGLTYSSTSTNYGGAVQDAGASDRSVQVIGTFTNTATGSGAITIQGSNDGTNWATLTDPQGNALVITTAKIEQISELSLFIRPLVTNGDAGTDLDVILLTKRPK